MMFVKRASFNGIYKLELELEKLILPYPVLRFNSENLRLTKRPLSKMRVSRSGNAVPLKELPFSLYISFINMLISFLQMVKA